MFIRVRIKYKVDYESVIKVALISDGIQAIDISDTIKIRRVMMIKTKLTAITLLQPNCFHLTLHAARKIHNRIQ